MKAIRFSIIWFLVWLLFASLFSPEHYNSFVYTISELTHQGYSRAWILLIGFFGNGILFVLSGLYYFKKNLLPSLLSKGLIIAGLCIIGLGLFQTNYDYYGIRPTDNILFMLLHIVFALLNQGTGYVMILYHIKYSDPGMKKIHKTILIINIIVAILFSITPFYRGTLQRLLFLISGLWFWFYFNRFKSPSK